MKTKKWFKKVVKAVVFKLTVHGILKVFEYLGDLAKQMLGGI